MYVMSFRGVALRAEMIEQELFKFIIIVLENLSAWRFRPLFCNVSDEAVTNVRAELEDGCYLGSPFYRCGMCMRFVTSFDFVTEHL